MSTSKPKASGSTKNVKIAVAVVLLLAAVGLFIWQFSGSEGQNAAPIEATNAETPTPAAIGVKPTKPAPETAAEKAMQTEGSLGGVRRVAPK